MPLADGGVVFRPGSERLCVLNATALLVWRLLACGADLEAAARALMASFGIERAIGLRDAAAVAAELRREGLTDPLPPWASETEPDTEPEPEPAMLLPADSEQSWPFYFTVAGCPFALVGAQGGPGLQVRQLLASLATDPSGVPPIRLAVVPHGGAGGGWDLAVDGYLQAAAVADDAVLPRLLTLVFMGLCAQLPQHLLLHAAVVCRGGEAVLFPAATGSGKTTLAAALAAGGLDLASDELAPLDPERLTVLPVPLPPSIKSGSLPLLAPFYPHLRRIPQYRRDDGKRVRYLQAPLVGGGHPPTPALPVRALVFPRLRLGQPAQLRRLGQVEALARLVETGSSDRPLTWRDVQGLVGLVRERPCYELEFAALAEAVALLRREVFGDPGGS